jgi:hypothetical protein
MTNPSISIRINDNDETEITDVETLKSNNAIKCKSMLNLGDNNFGSFKIVNNQKEDEPEEEQEDNNNNNQYISIYSSSRRLARKCLSRINLNVNNNNNNKSPNQQLDIINNNCSSISIMNLNTTTTTTTTNQKLNRLYYFKSSNLKVNNNDNSSDGKKKKCSSTSLNALLDLDMLDSVSIGSFDRQSFYSQCVNSECDLSDLCLIESTSNLFLKNNNKSKLLSLNSSNSLNIRKNINNKVIDWLEKI